MHITQQRLRERVKYDPVTGVFTWLPAPGRLKAGEPIGVTHAKGYLAVTLDGYKYLLHRLAWIYLNGSIPEGLEIDHRDGRKDNNAISNLRLGTHAQNQGNMRGCRSDSKSGVQGVQWRSYNNKWVVRIMVAGKRKHIGSFSCKDEAHQAYLAAKRELHIFCTI
jgi:hypothetical protein